MDLEQFLSDEKGRLMFMKFLEKEFSEENLEFWIECQRFKLITKNELIRKYSKEIYEKYISLNGPKSINIDGLIIKNIENNLEKPTNQLFDVAERHIFDLMQNDPFPRFLQTTQCQNYLSSLVTCQNSTNRKRKSSSQSPTIAQHQANNHDLSLKIKPISSRLSTIDELNFGHELYQNNRIINNNYENYPCDILAKKWSNNQFINVILPDGTKEFVSVIQNSTIHLVIQKLLEKKKQNNRNFKVFSVCDNKEIDLSRSISSLALTDIRIEFFINFSLNFPEGYLLKIETNANKLAFYTIQSIISLFNISIDDIELTSENGVLLHKNSLLKSVSILDNSVIHISYLSSLRTFVDFKDFHDLNQIEDGIKIKSIKLKKLQRPNSNSYDFFSVDCHDRNCQQKKCPAIEENKQNKENYYENTNVGTLSFSNDLKTDKLLQNFLMSDPCNNNQTFKNYQYNQTKQQPNYENILFKENKNNLHHARLMLIDEPYYENNDIIKIEKNIQKQKSKRNHVENNENFLCPSPFTKYLAEPKRINSNKHANQNNNNNINISNQIKNSISRSNKPDLIPNNTPNKSGIKTLSKFHKFI